MKFVLLVCFSLVIPCIVHAEASHFAGQRNAVWAGSIYLRGFDPTTQEKLTEGKLINLAERLKSNGIRYLYVFAGPYQKDGHLPSYAFSAHARTSVALLKKAYPSLKILAWVGGVEDKTVHLENETWRETSIRETVG